jgi:hypothetical protein
MKYFYFIVGIVLISCENSHEKSNKTLKNHNSKTYSNNESDEKIIGGWELDSILENSKLIRDFEFQGMLFKKDSSFSVLKIVGKASVTELIGSFNKKDTLLSVFSTNKKLIMKYLIVKNDDNNLELRSIMNVSDNIKKPTFYLSRLKNVTSFTPSL